MSIDITAQTAKVPTNGKYEIPLTQRKAVSIISRDLAYEIDVVPVSFDNNILVVGMLDPENKHIIEKIQQQTRTEVRGEQMSVRKIREGLAILYPPVTKQSNTEIENLFRTIIKTALTHHASDIHIEPVGTKMGAVRLRIDDVPTTIREFDFETLRRLIAYVKVRSAIDVSELVKPLDGRLSVSVDGRPIDMRVGVISGILGQKMALRVLGRFDLMRSLAEFGMEPIIIKRLTKGVARAGSFIIIAGPTGSGKTTLLYSLLRELDLRSINAYSVEDPVEIPVDSMTQTAVNEKAGLTFASTARAFVRQDPDLLIIGELRDKETVKECLSASTTGLNLLTTTHAKSAIHIIDRIVELGGERSRVAATMTMGVSQRLVRRLCRYCKIPTNLSAQAEKLRYRFFPDNPINAVAKSVGCVHCLGGYSGRFSVIEVLDVTPELQEIMKTSDSPIEIGRCAAENGYRPMVIDGLRHVLLGDTSEDELLRKLAYEDLIL